MHTNIGIDKKSTLAVVKTLSQILADAHVLYIKIRNFHWNLVGPRFHTLHIFYEEQYQEVEKAIDEIAERIRTVGGAAPGSMKEFLGLARLKEVSGGEHDGDESIKALVLDHEAIVRQLRQDIEACTEKYNDAGTADFLTDLMERHEKMAWMLRSFLSRSS